MIDNVTKDEGWILGYSPHWFLLIVKKCLGETLEFSVRQNKRYDSLRYWLTGWILVQIYEERRGETFINRSGYSRVKFNRNRRSHPKLIDSASEMKESFGILLGVEFINLGLATSSLTPTGGASARSQIRNTDDKAEPKKVECRKGHYILGHSQNQRNLEACGRRDGLKGQISVHFSPDIISPLATPAKSYLSLILLHISPQFPNWENRCDLLHVITVLHSILLLCILHDRRVRDLFLASSSLTPKLTWRPTTTSVKDLGEHEDDHRLARNPRSQ